jgi:hypothetical protein
LSDHTFRIVPVDHANAALVGAVFRSIYGEDFPVKDVYCPQVLANEIREGRVAACLALDEAGHPAGYASLFKNAPNPQLWEAGNLVVDPAYKHTDLSARLFSHYLSSGIDKILDGDGIYGEAVCHHYFTQVGCAKSGMADCAIELDQLDGSSFKDGKAKTDRVSCVLNFLEITAPPAETVYLPQKYAATLENLSRPLKPRSFRESTAPLPAQGITVWEDKHHSSARTWKVSVREVGADWPELLKKFLTEAAERQIVSLQIFLNTACPHISEAINLTRRQGFFLGGLVPRWFGTDGVLVQQVLQKEPDYDGIKLYSQTSRNLLEYIRADREEVRRQEL